MGYQNNTSALEREERFLVIAEEWLHTQRSQWKESSYMKYSNTLQVHLLPEFGEAQVTAITRQAVNSYLLRLLQEGGQRGCGLSPKTVTDILSVLKCVLLYASQTRGLHIDDLRGVSVKQRHKPLRVFSAEEHARLTHYLNTNLNLVNLGILLSLYTGLRIGELCALKWEDISLADRCIYVRSTLQRIQTSEKTQKTCVVITSPKSACSLRIIPLPDFLLPLLTSFACPPSCFFLTGSPCAWTEPRTMQNRFKAVLRVCGIRSASFHTCRHSFATRCVELGFDVKSLSEILGHSSVSITMNRYVHPSMDYKRQHMNRLAALIL